MRIAARLTLLAAGAAAFLLGMLWLDHGRVTTLPVPTGPFAVGRTQYLWTDAGHPDPRAPRPGTPRELLAWVWYPAAAPRESVPPAAYLPAPWRTAVERQRGLLLTQFLTRDLARVRVHSISDAAVSPQHRTYPVILMRAGLAALTTNYTALAEDLASQGYVVVGFDAPYRTTLVVLPDGTVLARTPANDADRVGGAAQEQLATELVRAWSADMSFALDELERLNQADAAGRFFGRLDLHRVGAFGHSLGGASVLQFCHDDPRCRAGVDVDGAPLGSVVRDGIRQPFLFLLSDHRDEPEAETRPVEAKIRSIYERLPSDRRWMFMIQGGGHYLFSDDGAALKSPPLMRVLRMLGIVRLDGRRQLALTSRCLSAFFDVYLEGASRSELQRVRRASELEPIP